MERNIAAVRPFDDIKMDLVRAFDWFNDKLFSNKLPTCMISYGSCLGRYGFYRRRNLLNAAKGAFGHPPVVDEISLNPDLITVRPLTDTLATLVHLMCRAKRASMLIEHPLTDLSYHDVVMASILKEVGLKPCQDGDPSKPETGRRVGHAIIAGGPFENACEELLDSGFLFSWIGTNPRALPSSYIGQDDIPVSPSRSADFSGPDQMNADSPVPADGRGDHEALPDRLAAPLQLPEPSYASLGDQINRGKAIVKPKRMQRYCCPVCGVACYGPRNIRIICQPCLREFIDQDVDSLGNSTSPKLNLLRKISRYEAAPGAADGQIRPLPVNRRGRPRKSAD